MATWIEACGMMNPEPPPSTIQYNPFCATRSLIGYIADDLTRDNNNPTSPLEYNVSYGGDANGPTAIFALDTFKHPECGGWVVSYVRVGNTNTGNVVALAN